MEVLQMPNKQFPCIGVEHWKISLSVYWDLLNLQRDHNGVWKGRTFAYNHSRLLYSCKHQSRRQDPHCFRSHDNSDDFWLFNNRENTLSWMKSSAFSAIDTGIKCWMCDNAMPKGHRTIPKYLTSLFPLMWWHCRSGTIVFVLIARTNAK
jgi:hypothetical protein